MRQELEHSDRRHRCLSCSAQCSPLMTFISQHLHPTLPPHFWLMKCEHSMFLAKSKCQWVPCPSVWKGAARSEGGSGWQAVGGEAAGRRERKDQYRTWCVICPSFILPICKPCCGAFDRCTGTGTSGGPSPFGSDFLYPWFQRKGLTLGLS